MRPRTPTTCTTSLGGGGGSGRGGWEGGRKGGMLSCAQLGYRHLKPPPFACFSIVQVFIWTPLQSTVPPLPVFSQTGKLFAGNGLRCGLDRCCSLETAIHPFHKFKSYWMSPTPTLASLSRPIITR
ncbi:unnamed protein product [Mesocestoides corti]|uniref:Uncharacterized protein n=1 Tax=Mesocestoides corti TaxID=53468 RepID=A0A0R3UJI5_MESCO|nr:unnamed protein product [Mesocestoides corti]